MAFCKIRRTKNLFWTEHSCHASFYSENAGAVEVTHVSKMQAISNFFSNLKAVTMRGRLQLHQIPRTTLLIVCLVFEYKSFIYVKLSGVHWRGVEGNGTTNERVRYETNAMFLTAKKRVFWAWVNTALLLKPICQDWNLFPQKYVLTNAFWCGRNGCSY